MSAARRDRNQGFALLEAIAVLFLSALVLLTLLIAADLVTRNSAGATRRANQIEELATGIAALRRDIAAAMDVRSSAAPEVPIFFGNAGALGLAIATGATEQEAGGSLVLIQASYDKSGGSLVRTSGRLLPDSAGFADARLGNPVNLLSGPWTYRFAYAAVGPAGLEWRDSWSEVPRLPAAVRLDVFHARQNQRVVPSLIVPLRVNADLICIPTENEPCGEEEEEDFDEDPDRDGNEEEAGGDTFDG